MGWVFFFFCFDFARPHHGASQFPVAPREPRAGDGGVGQPRQRRSTWVLLSRGKFHLFFPNFWAATATRMVVLDSSAALPVTEAGSALWHIPGYHRLCGVDTSRSGAGKTELSHGHRTGLAPSLVPGSQGGFAKEYGPSFCLPAAQGLHKGWMGRASCREG